MNAPIMAGVVAAIIAGPAIKYLGAGHTVVLCLVALFVLALFPAKPKERT